MIKYIPDQEYSYLNHIELMQEVVAKTGIKSMAEIGVLYGDFAVALAPLVDRYIMVDPWGYYPEEWRKTGLGAYLQSWWDDVHGIAMEKMAPLMDRCLVLRMSSEEGAKQVGDGSLDCVFIDAVHEYEPVLMDIASWLPKLRPGGLLAGHDWWDDGTRHGATMEGVKRALLDTFSPEIVHISDTWDHVWLVYKEDI